MDSDKLVAIIEKQVVKVTSGVDKYTMDKDGHPNHDLQWGPGYLTSLGVQWVDGKQVGVWPYKWVAAQGAPELTYKGVVPYAVAPWVIAAHKK